jgi:hypothetical protein
MHTSYMRDPHSNAARDAPPSPQSPRRKRAPRRLRAAAKPHLTVEQILAWADHHHERTGSYPNHESGVVLASKNETWKAIHLALLRGGRGLPTETTLARLLSRKRGVRNKHDLPRLAEETILRWADRHRRQTGAWPTEDSGSIAGAPGEVWRNVEQALRSGGRGLPGRDSLGRLLGRRRSVRNRCTTPLLSVAQILTWADDHIAATGCWPNTRAGPVASALGEKWNRIDEALYLGQRGLPGGSSLARLLFQHRGVRNRVRPPRLTADEILGWADQHRRKTGDWPTQNSGAVISAPRENWRALDGALRLGLRGLAAGSSLPRLLAERRAARNRGELPSLTFARICDWAREHRDFTGQWPSQASGPVSAAPGENWAVINTSLRKGLRGLPGGDSLALLLHRRFRKERRGK